MKYFTLITATIMPMLGFLGAAQTIDPNCLQSAGKFKKGTASCHCSGGSVTCEPFTLCGVGNEDATVALSSTSTATVRCRNPGGNIVDVKTQPVRTSAGDQTLQAKNGCVTVPSLSAKPINQDFLDRATCPNPNWTKMLVAGTIKLESFTYTLSFDGCAYITVTECTT